MAGDWGQVMNVVAQEGDHVLLSFRMDGFPTGFKLRPGERVVVVSVDQDLVAKPLVREFTVNNVTELTRDALKAEQGSFALQASTVRDDQGHRGPFVLTVVDRGSAEGPEQVIAIRPAEE